SSSTGCGGRYPRWTSSSPTTTAPTVPARSPTGWPPPTPPGTGCPRPGSRGPAPPTRAGFGGGPGPGARARGGVGAGASPAPEQLHRLLDALRDADLVIGSRYVPGGTVLNWPKSRLMISRGGSLYTRLCLGVPYRDTTAGYRAYRMPVLDKIEIDSVTSQGYC